MWARKPAWTKSPLPDLPAQQLDLPLPRSPQGCNASGTQPCWGLHTIRRGVSDPVARMGVDAHEGKEGRRTLGHNGRGWGIAFRAG